MPVLPYGRTWSSPRGRDGEPFIKVLDFGLAKDMSPMKHVAKSGLTQTNVMLGSPLYMSPEQVRSSRDVDRRTDVWSLGATLYHLVAGEVPFPGTSHVEIVEKKGLRQVSDTAAIEAAVDVALAAHPAQVAQYAANPKVLGFFVGQVMKATQGKANPALVNELLQKKLAD